MSLHAAERALYQGVWTDLETYGDIAPGEFYLPLFLQVAGESRGHVLDAGCGSGKGALGLQRAGFRVSCCDLTDAGLVDEAKALPFSEACLWHSLKWCAPLGSFEWVYCCDVMEHLPTQFTMLAVEQMLRVSRKGVFLGIATVPDQFGVWAGRALHQTVQPFTWWKDALGEVGTIVDARDLILSASFYVRPR